MIRVPRQAELSRARAAGMASATKGRARAFGSGRRPPPPDDFREVRERLRGVSRVVLDEDYDFSE